MAKKTVEKFTPKRGEKILASDSLVESLEDWKECIFVEEYKGIYICESMNPSNDIEDNIGGWKFIMPFKDLLAIDLENLVEAYKRAGIKLIPTFEDIK